MDMPARGRHVITDPHRGPGRARWRSGPGLGLANRRGRSLDRAPAPACPRAGAGHAGEGDVCLRIPVYAVPTEQAAFDEPRDTIRCQAALARSTGCAG